MATHNTSYIVSKPRYWTGGGPTHCDLCKRRLTTHFTDGRLYNGTWAFTCDACALHHGVNLGIGRGQRYELQQDKRWMKVGG